MRSVIWLVVFGAASCVQASSITCGDWVCPSGTACVELMGDAGDPHRCVDPDAIAACSNVAPLGTCSYSGLASAAACYATATGSVCLPSGCGNGLVDTGEACDDGNAAVGDGCSAACTSNEQCGNDIVDPLKLADGKLVLAETCDDGNFRGHDGCTGVCDRTEAPAWARVDVTHPSGRVLASITYDPNRGRLVLYGGQTVPPTGCFVLTTPFFDTWESADGLSWVDKTPTFGPETRFWPMIAYDGTTRRVILFGGSDNGGTQFNDMWSWDGERWSRLTPPQLPTARAAASMVYDARNHKLVLFGGNATVPTGGYAHVGDTWEWDGTTWTQRITLTQPTARSGHTLAYDPVRGVIVMAGGATDAGAAADTWEYDGSDWRLAASSGAPAVASMAYDATANAMISYTTAIGGSTWSTYAWNGAAWTNLGGTAPGTLFQPAVTTDPAGHALMFGGVINTYSGSYPNTVCNHAVKYDSWSWGGSQWTTMPVPAPTSRTNIAGAVDLSRRRAVIVGGRDNQNNAVENQTWEYDGASWKLFDAQPWSAGREFPAMAHDIARAQLVLFGGNDASNARYNDTYVRSGTTWSQVNPALPLPPARSGAGMAYDAARARVIMFGGFDSSNMGLADTWSWDGTAWTELHPAHSPPARALFAIGYDYDSKRIVLFGGFNTSGPMWGDTWTWDGSDWTEQQPTSKPSPRSFPSMAWDATRRRLVVAGGGGAVSPRDDAWEWDAAVENWVELPIPATRPAPTGHVTLSALDGAGIETFGGRDYSGNAAPIGIWRMRWEDAGAYETCTDQTDDDGDGLAGCADPDCWTTCTPLCLPGETCDPAAAHCGDHVCNAGVEDCRNCPDDCTTCTTTFCGDTICNGTETSGTCRGDCP